MNVFYKSKIIACVNNTSLIVNCKLVFNDTSKSVDMDSKIEETLSGVIISQDFSSLADEIYKKIPSDYTGVPITVSVENEHGGYEKNYDAQSNSVNLITDNTGAVKGIITNKLGSVNVISIDSLNKDTQDKIIGRFTQDTVQPPPNNTPPPPSDNDGSAPPNPNQKDSNRSSVKGSVIFKKSVEDVFDNIDNFCPNTDLIDDLPNADDPKWVKIKQQIQELKDKDGGPNASTTN